MGRLKRWWAWFSGTRAWQSWERFGNARGNLLASGIAFYGFFSIFPTVAIAAVIFGFVLQGNADLIETVGNAVNSALPNVIKNTATPNGLVALSSPDTSFLTISGIVSVVVLIVSGTGWVGALRDGIRAIFGVQGAPGNVLTVKLRDVGVLFTLGLVVLFSVVLTVATGTLGTLFDGVVGETFGGLLVSVIGFVVGFVVDGGIMVVLLRVLTGVPLPWKDIRQGAMVGALGQGIVKLFGVQLISNATKNPLYGSLILVIGLLFWFNLIAKLILIGAAWAANDIDTELARLEAETGHSLSDDEVRDFLRARQAGATQGPRSAGAAGASVPVSPTAPVGVAGAAAIPSVGGAGAIAARRGHLPWGAEARAIAARDRAGVRAANADLETARGRAVGGIPMLGERASDRTTIAAGAVLGATVAVVVGSVGRAVRAVVRRS